MSSPYTDRPVQPLFSAGPDINNSIFVCKDTLFSAGKKLEFSVIFRWKGVK
jgi:hypothetical protein